MTRHSFFIAILTIALIYAVSSWGMGKKALTTSSETPDSTTQWVGKSDAAKSCEKSAISLDTMANELKKKDVQVFAKKKVHDGKMRIQMCGADKGDMNGFLISKKDLEKAKSLGFEPVVVNPRDIH